MARTALVAGASGLIGGYVLDRLLAEPRYGRVVSIGRRILDRQHAKLEQRIVDFDQLEDASGLQADDVFCCLGTTIKKAGSQEAFRRVDYLYPLDLARTARAQGADQFLIVTSLGADAGSSVFYSRVKGEVEQAIRALDYPTCYFLRPSLLLGERDEVRTGEQIAQAVMPALRFLFVGPFKKYRPIHAERVAGAMVHLALHGPAGTYAVDSD
ncbi:MAG: oxidoreductase, partial [Bacteroidota bacterium]